MFCQLTGVSRREKALVLLACTLEYIPFSVLLRGALFTRRDDFCGSFSTLKMKKCRSMMFEPGATT